MEKRTCTIEGCNVPHQRRGRTLYNFDESFFDTVDSESRAYWLGFITADGCVRVGKGLNQLVVKLKASDAGHLEKLRSAFDGDHPIGLDPRQGVAGPSARIAFSSPHLVASLAVLGVGPRKSAVVEPWDGPKDLMPHYWRGLFDGDGGISKDTGRKWQLSLCGSKACVDAFAEWGRRACGSTARPVFRSNIWYWHVAGMASPQALVRELYGNASVYLDRKYELAQQLLAQPILARSWHGQICGREGCSEEAEVKGRCRNHYRADWFATTDGIECAVDGCPERQIANGYCTKHYQRDRKHGDALRVKRGREGARRNPLEDLFFDEVDTSEKAFWLGFTAACGSVVRSAKTFQVRFELPISGESHLVRLRDALGSTKPFKYRTGARLGDLVGVVFDSWRLVDALERHGVTTRTGMTVTRWGGPDFLMPHYWRGVDEGNAHNSRPRSIPKA